MKFMKKSSLQTMLEKIKDQPLISNEDNQANSKMKTVLIGSHFTPEIQKQLKILSAEEGKTHHVLLLEALELLFTKYGKQKF